MQHSRTWASGFHEEQPNNALHLHLGFWPEPAAQVLNC